MLRLLEMVNSLVWGVPALFMILGVGIYLTLSTRFAQFRLFPQALYAFLRRFKDRKNSDGVSSYRALCTALAATVGTGNIAGVAGAIAIGGPGAVFWMWICALLGMIIKFAEATLCVAYRRRDKRGELVGGPMYMLQQSLPKCKWLSALYCFFGIVASFGVGNGTQINAVVGGFRGIADYIGLATGREMDVMIGIALAVLILLMMLGGVNRIGAAAEQLVPFAAVGYIFMCLVVIIGRFQNIPNAFGRIILGAFSPAAVSGGIIGSAFVTLRIGISRGVFTNEAGLGTAGIAHAAAEVQHPVEQGLMGIMEVFLDTIVICTMTALVILCSGVPIPYGTDIGITLTTQAFSTVFGPWVSIPVTVALCCFAIATIFGWGLYGIRCVQFLFGENAWKSFVYLQAGMAIVGAAMRTDTVWMLAETVNGLMAIPNLIILAFLAPKLQKLVLQYTSVKKLTAPRNSGKVIDNRTLQSYNTGRILKERSELHNDP